MADAATGMAGVTSLGAMAERVAAGDVLTGQDAAAVLAAHDLITIGMMGDAVRQRMHGTRTTFGRVFEIHVEAVPAALPPHAHAGELRIVGRPRSLEAAYAAAEAARRLAGSLPVSGFTLADLVELRGGRAGVYERLKGAGLDAVAEVPLDVVTDVPTEVAAILATGLLTPRLTVHHPSSDPVALMEKAVQAQDATGAFRAFAPLPRIISAGMPTTGYDDVKMVAVARVLVRNISSIQVDWALYGPKLAQVALTVGADDVDGVAAADVEALGHRRSALEEIRRNIRAAGLEPVERNGRYDPAPASGGEPGEAARGAH